MNSLCKNFCTALFSLITLTGLNAQSSSIQDRIECPGTVQARAFLGTCEAQVVYTEPFENIARGELRLVQNNHGSETYFPVGETSVYYKATDQQNSTYFCMFSVKVSDVEAPVILDLPAQVEVETTATSGALVHWDEPELEDNCGNVDYYSTHESGDVFPIGKTKVTYHVYDESGNVTTESMIVSVVKVPELITSN